MAQMNKVLLIGRLTLNPELRRLANGTAVTDLGLAMNRTYTGKDGEKREEVTYIDMTVWDRQAETCCQYLKKGRAVHVEGFLKMDSWEDKNAGEKRSKVKVQADRVQFLDRQRRGRRRRRSGGDDDFAARPPASRPPVGAAPEPRADGQRPVPGRLQQRPRRPARPGDPRRPRSTPTATTTTSRSDPRRPGAGRSSRRPDPQRRPSPGASAASWPR